ncbi:unnamed protein product [Symbiodinium sp. CCMP2592]|nr:unnamed protein product [Symbiodinium sp. CCMP2592]
MLGANARTTLDQRASMPSRSPHPASTFWVTHGQLDTNRCRTSWTPGVAARTTSPAWFAGAEPPTSTSWLTLYLITWLDLSSSRLKRTGARRVAKVRTPKNPLQQSVWDGPALSMETVNT